MLYLTRFLLAQSLGQFADIYLHLARHWKSSRLQIKEDSAAANVHTLIAHCLEGVCISLEYFRTQIFWPTNPLAAFPEESLRYPVVFLSPLVVLLSSFFMTGSPFCLSCANTQRRARVTRATFLPMVHTTSLNNRWRWCTKKRSKEVDCKMVNTDENNAEFNNTW